MRATSTSASAERDDLPPLHRDRVRAPHRHRRRPAERRQAGGRDTGRRARAHGRRRRRRGRRSRPRRCAGTGAIDTPCVVDPPRSCRPGRSGEARTGARRRCWTTPSRTRPRAGRSRVERPRTVESCRDHGGRRRHRNLRSRTSSAIFTKFFRSERVPAGQGSGLGLFLVRGLVDAMGGRIWLESEEGTGSRFTFELPLTGSEAVEASPSE